MTRSASRPAASIASSTVPGVPMDPSMVAITGSMPRAANRSRPNTSALEPNPSTAWTFTPCSCSFRAVMTRGGTPTPPPIRRTEPCPGPFLSPGQEASSFSFPPDWRPRSCFPTGRAESSAGTSARLVGNPVPRGPKTSTVSPGCTRDSQSVPLPTTLYISVSTPSFASHTEIGRRRKYWPHFTSTNCPGPHSISVSRSSFHTSRAIGTLDRTFVFSSFICLSPQSPVPSKMHRYRRCHLRTEPVSARHAIVRMGTPFCSTTLRTALHPNGGCPDG